MKNRIAAAYPLVMLLSMACSGGGSGNALTVEELCQEDNGAFHTFVDKIFTCNPEFELFLGAAPSAADITAACVAQFEPFIDDGTVAFSDRDKLEACIAAVSAADCETLEIDNIEACDDIFVGQVEEGQACESNDQCVGQSYCDNESTSSDCGICTAQLADGATCEDNESCSSGKCRSSGVCGPFAALGDTCDDSEDCSGRLICNGGLCASAGDSVAGDSCAEFAECGFPFSNLYCDEQVGECKNFLAVGEDCFDGSALLGVCDLLAYDSCDFEDTRKCIAPTIVGLEEACGFGSGLKCEEGLLCESGEGGVCRESGPGATCDPTREGTCGLFLECKEDGKCGYEVDYTGMCPADF